MNRKTAVVLFGGQSSEHVVSCMSVVNVINHMNREKYDLLLQLLRQNQVTVASEQDL